MPSFVPHRARTAECLPLLFLVVLSLLSSAAEAQWIKPGVKQVAIGRFHTVALMDDDTVRCWGRNDWGECGSNGTVGNSRYKQVAAGYGISVLLTKNGTLEYYGYSATEPASSILRAVQEFARDPNATIKEVSMSSLVNHQLIVLFENGTLHVLGSLGYGGISSLDGVQQVSAGAGFFGCVMNNGSARAFGETESFYAFSFDWPGKLDTSVVSNAKQIASGSSYVAVLWNNGSVHILGHPASRFYNSPWYSYTDDRFYDYYFGRQLSYSEMDEIERQTDVAKVIVGRGVVILLHKSGVVRGFPSRNLDLWWLENGKIVDVAAGETSAIFIYQDGRIASWGDNTIPEDLKTERVAAPPPEPPAQGFPAGAIAGLAVLGAAVLILIVAVALLVLRLRRRSESLPPSVSKIEEAKPNLETEKPAFNLVYPPPALLAKTAEKPAEVDPQVIPEENIGEPEFKPAEAFEPQSRVEVTEAKRVAPIMEPVIEKDQEPMPLPKASASGGVSEPVKAFATAKKAYKGGRSGLNLEVGDRIYVDEIVDGWAKGICTKDGSEGIVPVDVLDIAV